MSSKHTAVISEESITVFMDGDSYTLKRGDENFDAAVEAAREGRWEEVPPLVARGFALEQWASGDFQFRDGLMHYMDLPIDHRLNDRMITMSKEGKDPRFLMKFWEKLQENPSHRSVNQLFAFLEHNNIAIDQDGFILAYKGVRNDFKDKWSGTIDNSIGKDVSYPRNRISDDPRAACAEGLHAGALSYARSYACGQRLVIVRIHPKDVVSVPYDSNAQKMRLCAYKVIGNFGGDMGLTLDTSEDEATRDLISAKTADSIESTADSFAEKLGAGARTSSQGSSDLKGFKAPKVPRAAAQSNDAAEPWLTFDNLSDAEIAVQRVWDLRKYASRVLGIVGASKLKKETDGGDLGLVDSILKERKKKSR